MSLWSVSVPPPGGHPWLPQDDRLSYRESLKDSGVSRTWGRLGDRVSSGRSLRSSSPASRLISGTLGARVFPLRLKPVGAGMGRLPGSTARLDEGPLAFRLWEEQKRSRGSRYGESTACVIVSKWIICWVCEIRRVFSQRPDGFFLIKINSMLFV